jgi:hypothetical protein
VGEDLEPALVLTPSVHPQRPAGCCAGDRDLGRLPLPEQAAAALKQPVAGSADPEDARP